MVVVNLLVQSMHPKTVLFSPLTAYCGVFPTDVTMAPSFTMLGNTHRLLITLITVGKHSKQLNFNVDKGREGKGRCSCKSSLIHGLEKTEQ